MPIFIGNSSKNQQAIYVGTQPIQKVYFGDKLVWQKPKVFTPIDFGLLYNWYVITDPGNIAPSGWHVPSKTEFETLFTGLGGSTAAAGYLKKDGLIYWNDPNTISYPNGFNATGSGRRNGYSGSGLFYDLKELFYVWTSTIGSSTAYYIYMIHDSVSIGNPISESLTFKDGRSIRLIKDDSTDPGTMTGNDGKIYPTVKIGNQIWMAVNLAETRYLSGVAIPEVTNNAAWAALTTGALCAYNNDWSNV